MPVPRGFYNPWPKAIKRYGSPSMYIFLLLLSLLPTLVFFFGSIVSLAQLIRRRTWYLSGVVVAGPLIAWGLVFLQSLQVDKDPWIRDRAKVPSVSFIDIGTTLLAHSLSSTLTRLAWSVLPDPAGAATRSTTTPSLPDVDGPNRDRRKVLRDRRVGYYLLVPHAFIGVAATCSWTPWMARLTPFAQLPFCAYFAFVAWEYRRQAREEWGMGEEEDEEEEEEGEEGRRVKWPGRLFDGLVVAAGGLTVRSILGIIAVAFDIYTKAARHPVGLIWAIVCDDIVIFCGFSLLRTVDFSRFVLTDVARP
ncbi:uncharacterized protein BKCO1_9500018 [Diplodia corticola]|uniref:Uncharacterized protein n=1 Tax=Diplodia corticola TaxID=236234 RepID=A0A1J9RNA2_9PEZI|nr:uncharacterized protein BKCO1_9500018 [Diplodia corticola]OJD29077.1 hypothetical protein BKCO1_9500018 [Diplodia corticola]